MDLGQKHFERSSQHHAQLAKRHHAIIKLARGGMSKADADPVDVLEEVLEELQAIAEEHVDMGEHCNRCAETAGKESMERAERADRDRFSVALAPDGVRKTVPNAPPAGFTPIPRHGAPPIPVVVEAGLAKIAGSNPEDIHSDETSLQRL